MTKSTAYEKARKGRLKEGRMLQKERTKTITAEEKLLKTEQSIKEKRAIKFKQLTKPFKARQILKTSRPTLHIQEHKQEPYKPIYMKDVIEEDKRQFFFKR